MCDAASITAAHDPCQYAKDHCGDEFEVVPFIDYYYCNFGEGPLRIVITIVFAIVFVAVVFNFLGSTADTYLGPTLEAISKELKLSDAIAGVTLLALANGASDVISGIVAGGKASGGFDIAVGGLFGACLFTITCVLANCIMGAG